MYLLILDFPPSAILFISCYIAKLTVFLFVLLTSIGNLFDLRSTTREILGAFGRGEETGSTRGIGGE